MVVGHIFAGGLRVVVRLAPSRPIVFVPEQALVATVRDDVVDDSGRRRPSSLEAVVAERMLGEIRLARLAPVAVIELSTGLGGLSVATALLLCVRRAAPGIGERRTSRFEAGTEELVWRRIIPSRAEMRKAALAVLVEDAKRRSCCS